MVTIYSNIKYITMVTIYSNTQYITMVTIYSQYITMVYCVVTNHKRIQYKRWRRDDV